MVSPLDLRRLRYFKAIAECRSMSAAARALNVAQPALSHHVAELERGLGASLFKRIPQGIELTETGQLLLRHSVAILARVAEAEEELRAALGQPPASITIRLAVIPSLVSDMTPILVAAVARERPEWVLHIIDARTSHIQELIERGRTDFALFLGNHRTPHDEPLAWERLVFAAPTGMLDGDGPIRFADLAHCRLILPAAGNPLRLFLEEAAQRAGIRFNVVMDIDGPDPRRHAVAAGLGATIFGAHSVSDITKTAGLVARPIVEPVLTRPIYLGVRPGVDREIRTDLRRMVGDTLVGIAGIQPGPHPAA
jgi:LysR family nitrogen assimilation transcriptional regulator